jgi:histidinol dehydrogenase
MESIIKIINWKSISTELKQKILLRSEQSYDAINEDVRRWVNIIKSDGDKGIHAYINAFDTNPPSVENFRVSDKQIAEAYKKVPGELLQMIKEQIALSKKFHTAVMKNINIEFEIEQLPGVRAGYRKAPIDSAGLYVPAGKAPLPTVAQILTVAAKAASVPRIVVCFPPTQFEDAIIVAANEAGASEIYRIGGIAAIAALAFGTESIAPVQKIVGPGNPWVQAAKLQVVNKVGIDMFSGPSEAVILADETSNPAYLAADILARCEHGPDSAGVLITTSTDIAKKTAAEIEKQIKTLSRLEYINKALYAFSAIIVVDSEKEMIDLTNQYKPEHLEIQTKNPQVIFQQIRHAGSTFLGDFAPVAVGDYASGTNHCLPTGCATAYSSAVSPETFLKTLQFQELTKEGLKSLEPIVRVVSNAEGLDAHNQSVQIRFV